MNPTDPNPNPADAPSLSDLLTQFKTASTSLSTADTGLSAAQTELTNAQNGFDQAVVGENTAIVNYNALADQLSAAILSSKRPTLPPPATT